MTTTDSETERPEPRVRASTVIGAIGALSVVGTLALWWIGTFPGDSEEEISREVFGNIPDLVVALFYVLVSAFIGMMSGLQFAVQVVTDEIYRSEFAEGMTAELREAMAVRTVYHQTLVG